MTSYQLSYLNSLELAIANLIHDNHRKGARALSAVVEWLHKDDPVTALLEAEAIGFDERLLGEIRDVFDIRKFS